MQKCSKYALAFSLSVFITVFSMAQPTVKVHGSSGAHPLRDKAELFLAQLDVVEDLHLTIALTRLTGNFKGLTVKLDSPDPDYLFLRVLIDDRLSRNSQLRVLAHEMVHVKQYAKNELVVEKDGVVWNGQRLHYGAYDKSNPWESEAYLLDSKLVAMVQTNERELQNLLAMQSLDKEGFAFCKDSRVNFLSSPRGELRDCD
jgi:hypothetical protein